MDTLSFGLATDRVLPSGPVLLDLPFSPRDNLNYGSDAGMDQLLGNMIVEVDLTSLISGSIDDLAGMQGFQTHVNWKLSAAGRHQHTQVRMTGEKGRKRRHLYSVSI